VVRRKEPGEFAENTIELLQTFAAHASVSGLSDVFAVPKIPNWSKPSRTVPV